jgi:hypothetical protein
MIVALAVAGVKGVAQWAAAGTKRGSTAATELNTERLHMGVKVQG